MNTSDNLKREIEQILSEAELLYSESEVQSALDRMAKVITQRLQDKLPIVLCPMIGAVIPVGQLLPKLNFPLQVEYIHITRYRGTTKGGEIQWKRKPSSAVSGRTILIVDDILDEGITLKAIIDECQQAGAKEIFTAVLVDKQINKPKHFEKADFTGLIVPDKYVFGYGMDYKEYLRNCDGIYAVKES